MGGGVALDAALEAPERVAGLVLLAPAVSGDPELDEDAYIAATDGLAEAIDAAWTAGDVEACNRLEVRLWRDGPAQPEGRVSGPPRELALEGRQLPPQRPRLARPPGTTERNSQHRRAKTVRLRRPGTSQQSRRGVAHFSTCDRPTSDGP